MVYNNGGVVCNHDYKGLHLLRINQGLTDVVVEHEGDIIRNPRVEFHFINRYTDAQYLAPGGIDVTGTTESTPYNFVNTAGKYQTTQILKHGETMELIPEPDNINLTINGTKTEKYFYGWYVVEMVSDAAKLNSTTGKYTGRIEYNWPEHPNQVHFEKAISITPNPGSDNKLMAGDTLNWTMAGVSGSGTLDATGTVHVYVAPIYEDFYFINFHKGTVDSESTLKNSLAVRKLVVFGSADSAEVRIGNVMCDSSDPQHSIFSGWQEEVSNGSGGTTYTTYRTVNHRVDEHGDIINEEKNYPDGYTGYYITVNKTVSTVFNLDLYPVFDEARWIYFERGVTGNGSTYVGASYRLSNDDRNDTDTSACYYLNSGFFAGDANTQSHMSRRAGYSMEGWYLFANMNGSSEITNKNSAESVTIKVVDINAKSVNSATPSNISNVSVTTGGTAVNATSAEVNNDGEITITVPLKAIKLVNSDGSFAQTNGFKQTVTYTLDGRTTKTVTLFEMDGGVLRYW